MWFFKDFIPIHYVHLIIFKNLVLWDLHELFIKVWSMGMVPAEWRDGIIISLYKGKVSRNYCASYWSIPGKVFCHVLLSWFEPLLTHHCHPQQSSFTKGLSTVDAVLTL